MGFTPPPPARPRQGLAIASLVIGILSLPTLGCLGVGAVLSIVLGIMALVRAGRDPREYGGRGFAIGGIVASAISLVVAAGPQPVIHVDGDRVERWTTFFKVARHREIASEIHVEAAAP